MSYVLEGGGVTLHLICHICQPERSSIARRARVGPGVIQLCANDGVVTGAPVKKDLIFHKVDLSNTSLLKHIGAAST